MKNLGNIQSVNPDEKIDRLINFRDHHVITYWPFDMEFTNDLTNGRPFEGYCATSLFGPHLSQETENNYWYPFSNQSGTNYYTR